RDERIGNFKFLVNGHRRARRLLAIAQRCVEDPYPLPYGRLRRRYHRVSSIALTILPSAVSKRLRFGPGDPSLHSGTMAGEGMRSSFPIAPFLSETKDLSTFLSVCPSVRLC